MKEHDLNQKKSVGVKTSLIDDFQWSDHSLKPLHNVINEQIGFDFTLCTMWRLIGKSIDIYEALK